jgi:hypothetical protein
VIWKGINGRLITVRYNEADTEEMATNLGNWYSILETKVAPKLSEVVKPIYSEVVREYRRAKKPKALKKIPVTV